MTKAMGWWRFDSERIAMVHSLTGQTVRYLGVASADQPLSLTSSANRVWLRFDYEDRETGYPLLVEWRNVPGHGRPLVWRIDHERSARLWRHLSNTDAAYPRFGLWHRVDNCAIDALACWPSHPSTGPHATCVAVNGGWFNGAWTPSFYRAIRCLLPTIWPSGVDADCPALTPLDAPAPLPWAYFDAVDARISEPPDVAAWVSEPSRIALDMERLARCRPHLRSTDGSRLVLGLPRRQGHDPTVHERSLIYRARLLYADPDIVADGLVADIGRRSGPNPLEWSMALRGEGGIGVVARADGKPIAPVRVSSYSNVNVSGPPHWVLMRLAHSMIDARLSHPSLGVDFTPGADDLGRVLRGEPLRTLAVRFRLAGLIDGNLCAATSLLPPRAGGDNSLTTQLFDEERDGIVRASAVVKTFGYWAFDPESRSLINQASDQRLQFVGECPAGDLGQTKFWGIGGRSWRFLYQDSVAEYPLVVRSQSRARDHGPSLAHHWIVDHEGAAGLWRERHNGSKVPGYGLWRRVDSCALDALLCWPEIEATGPMPGGFEIRSGWSNGSWTTDLVRTVFSGYEHGFDPPDEQTEDPFVEALDASAQEWTFVDAPEMAGRADLADVQELAPGRFYLPADRPLTGFEARMPHLRRGDGKAVIFPAGRRERIGRHDHADAWFLYADEDLFFLVAASARSPYWNVYLTRYDPPSAIGLRNSGRFDAGRPGSLPADLFVQRQSQYSFGEHVSLTRNPSPALAHKVTVALLDAGLVWNHGGGNVSDLPERMPTRDWAREDPNDRQSIRIERGHTVIVDGGYVGGRFNSTYGMRATLAGG